MAAYQEQIAALAEVDEALILYRETRPLIPPGLETLTAVAAGKERIYAGGGGHVIVLTPQGDEIRRIATEGTITCLTADDQGTLYVGLGSAIHAYDTSGRPVAVFGGIAEDAILTSLAAAGEHVFAADARSRTVLRFTPDGLLQQAITGRQDDSGGRGFVLPGPFFDLAPGQGQTLWIVNPGRHRLEEYTFQGERIGAWPEKAGMGIEAFCGCCNPIHIARLGDGSIVTAEKGLPRVKLYTKRGGFVGVVVPPGQFDATDLSLDLAVDPDDRILVADPARLQIRVFERK